MSGCRVSRWRKKTWDKGFWVAVPPEINDVERILLEGVGRAREVKAHSVAIAFAGVGGWVSYNWCAPNGVYQVVGALEDLKIEILGGAQLG